MNSDAKEDLKIDDQRIQEYHDEAAACRDSLMLQFVHLESTAKKMTEIVDYERLTRNILIAAQQFLHRHMFTLQMLPKLKDILTCRDRVRAGLQAKMPIEQIEDKDNNIPKSDNPIVANKEAMQEKLAVLKEQETQLKEFLQNALQEGRSEEAALLHRALTECKDEITKLSRIINLSS